MPQQIPGAHAPTPPGPWNKTWLKLLHAPLDFGVNNLLEEVLHVFKLTGQGVAKVANMINY